MPSEKEKLTVWMDDPNDDQMMMEVELPSKFQVCGTCRGKGTHVNPNIDGNGISPEEFEQDPDFKEAYFSGVYDVECCECKGARVVLVVDEKAAADRCPAALKAYRAEQRAAREVDAEMEMERRMGA